MARRPTTNVSRQIERRVHHHDIDGFPGRQVYEVHEERDDDQIEDFPPDLNKCFSREGFDPKRFEEFARDFLSHESETGDDFEPGKEKAKIVSVLAKNLYITCTLTKSQIKTSRGFGRQ